ncbi:hypothetical protein Aau02nite_53780 [Amorphoplanes auranticolor]|uniref:Uncharacterized protein n=1 Tax=Actinoplanes auranticolor TaxID=47988 RepID=A0A919VRL2_9ACTN|nr:hypothetical protein Aau02nite_53780 [Actinoplanes auranticolor]
MDTGPDCCGLSFHRGDDEQPLRLHGSAWSRGLARLRGLAGLHDRPHGVVLAHGLGSSREPLPFVADDGR